jgi:hypothetical protein
MQSSWVQSASCSAGACVSSYQSMPRASSMLPREHQHQNYRAIPRGRIQPASLPVAVCPPVMRTVNLTQQLECGPSALIRSQICLISQHLQPKCAGSATVYAVQLNSAMSYCMPLPYGLMSRCSRAGRSSITIAVPLITHCIGLSGTINLTPTRRSSSISSLSSKAPPPVR